MAKPPLKPDLWAPRPVEKTMALYRDWAARYDADVLERGYHTPMATHVEPGQPILDYGCGTGISGAALKACGLGPLLGTDVTPEMLDVARDKDIFDHLWLSTPGQLEGRYGAIVAVGVVSLGAAPPETLDLLVDALDPGGILGLSFNDPTLADGRYDDALDEQIAGGALVRLSRDNGPHLDDMSMNSDVIVLRRT